jgi:formate/nitrite transporter FocA (FNT family)
LTRYLFIGWLKVQGGSLATDSQALVLKVAAMKIGLGAKQDFLRGMLYNCLVYLAV